MKKKILTILAMLIIALSFAGCGNKAENKTTSDNKEDQVLTALNDAVNEITNEWEKDGHKDIVVKDIQRYLDNYTIINSSRSAYTATDGSTEYTMQMIGSSNYSNQKAMLPQSEINYLLIYDQNKQKYYSVKISYDKVTIKNQYKYDIPKFVSATKI